jgi:hypothetical protein
MPFIGEKFIFRSFKNKLNHFASNAYLHMDIIPAFDHLDNRRCSKPKRRGWPKANLSVYSYKSGYH